ncbi:UNVERIFIED_CONTAM: hypothetical protein Sradi_7144600, partial [Sesamum radiatum]
MALGSSGAWASDFVTLFPLCFFPDVWEFMLSVPWVGPCPLTRKDGLACFALRWKEGFQRDFPIEK